MIVTKISLKNYRSHTEYTETFAPGINLLTGLNGAGKTNVVEAIYYLSLARSFRTSDEKELIKDDNEYAKINAVVKEGEVDRKIQIVLDRKGKHISVNGKPITKISELAKNVNVILFEPKDVMLFKGSPKERRNFLDVSISKKSTPYLETLSRYEKALRARNDLLKQEKIDRDLLEVTTEMLIKYSEKIISYRQLYLKDINDILIKITRALTHTQKKIEITYNPFVKCDGDFLTKAKQAFKRAEENDIKSKVTTIGAHREDFSILLNGREIGEYGSQGENRIVALALKLSPYFLIEDKDKRPVVVLDDVMSELDEKHQKQLVTFLKKFEQVFITATQLEIDGASHYTIKTKEKEVF